MSIDVSIVATGLENLLEQGMKIYPVPAADRVIIQFSNPNHEEYRLILTDVTGKVMKLIENIQISHIIPTGKAKHIII